ncbi:hypothetical protein ACUOGJ_24890, partial [Escherichia coli]
ATDIVVMRIMCRRGFEMDFAELLLEDYKASLKYLSDHPKLQGTDESPNDFGKNH